MGKADQRVGKEVVDFDKYGATKLDTNAVHLILKNIFYLAGRNSETDVCAWVLLACILFLLYLYLWQYSYLYFHLILKNIFYLPGRNSETDVCAWVLLACIRLHSQSSFLVPHLQFLFLMYYACEILGKIMKFMQNSSSILVNFLLHIRKFLPQNIVKTTSEM